MTGDADGVTIRYVEEPEPLGTAGAVKLAEPVLDERFAVLNGDVLTDLDISRAACASTSSAARARRSALYPGRRPVLLRRGRDRRRRARRGVPREAGPGTAPSEPHQRRHLRARARRARPHRQRARRCPSSARCSRRWSARASTRCGCDGYWLDIGTPERYLQATRDILAGTVETEVQPDLARADAASTDGAGSTRCWSAQSCGIAPGRRVRPGRDARRRRHGSRPGAVVCDSVAARRRRRRGGGAVVRDSIVGAGRAVGAGRQAGGRDRWREDARGRRDALADRRTVRRPTQRRLARHARPRPASRSSRSTPRGRWTTCWRCRSTSRTRCGASSRPASSACSAASTASAPDRVRHGRQRDRRRPRRAPCSATGSRGRC